MIERKDVEKLAKLTRIEISEKEKDALLKDLESVLGYVSEVGNVTSSVPEDHAPERLRNVMREDGEPHASGMYTEEILNEVPSKEDGYIKVKRILN
ncbi:MAG: hypothetical protein BMS9Abin13_590 [Patescibacteria group bacterium]|nr:MAG: hypothetical protein BMS9Abin13_590 [Patescibacteria group bacterium]